MVGSVGSSGTCSSYIEQMWSGLFKSADKNGDSKLDASEISQTLTGGSESGASSLLSGLDSDEDGVLGELEFESALSMLSQEMNGRKAEKDQELFGRIDTNGDGSVSQEEFVANRPEDMTEDQAAEMWGSLDAEGSGSLSESDFVTAMASQGPPPGGPPPGGPPPSSSSDSEEDETGLATLASSAADAAETAISDLFGKIDTDGDGSISKEEYLANRPEDVTEDQAAEMWSRLDSEGTGNLTESQFNTAMASQGPPPGGPPPGGPPPRASSGEDETETAALSSLTADETTAATDETGESGGDLVQLLANAMKSYMRNRSGFFGQDSAVGSFMSNYA